MLHLAHKAFAQGKFHFLLCMLIRSGNFRRYNFHGRTLQYEHQGLDESQGRDGQSFSHGSEKHTQIMKTDALKQALDHYRFDAAFGGARRDEKRSRAKERFLLPE